MDFRGRNYSIIQKREKPERRSEGRRNRRGMGGGKQVRTDDRECLFLKMSKKTIYIHIYKLKMYVIDFFTFKYCGEVKEKRDL